MKQNNLHLINEIQQQNSALRGENRQLKSELDLAKSRLARLAASSNKERQNHLLETRSLHAKLAYAQKTDELTGIGNRQALKERIEELAKNSPDSVLIVLFIDIDNFKFINDNFSHEAGDLVLQTIADILSRAKRPFAVLCRYGGDEFCILGEPRQWIPGQCLENIVESIFEGADFYRREVENFDWASLPCWENKEPPTITISIGVSGGIFSDNVHLDHAFNPMPETSAQHFLRFLRHEADKKMLAAKRKRNATVVSTGIHRCLKTAEINA